MLRSAHKLAATVESLEEETLNPHVNEEGLNVRRTSSSPDIGQIPDSGWPLGVAARDDTSAQCNLIA